LPRARPERMDTSSRSMPGCMTSCSMARSSTRYVRRGS
jgi:hypothetical protein